MPRLRQDSDSSEESNRKSYKRKHKEKYHHNRENRYKYRSRSRSPHVAKREKDDSHRSPERYSNRRHGDDSRDRQKYRHRHRAEKDGDFDPHIRIKREPDDQQIGERERNDERRIERRQQDDQFGDGRNAFGIDNADPANQEQEKEGPNFEVSGKLAEDTNTYKGVVIKYNEPPEARKPKRRWRLYAFKGDNVLPMLQIHRQSAYLLGRDRVVVDIPTDHPSCSKQHAVLQYRLVSFERDDGTAGRRVRPYIIDLESSNGTFVNNQKIESRCYVELLEKDVLKFGFSSREYVLLHDTSKGDQDDDDPGIIES